MVKSVPPVKYKCTHCGMERWIKPSECACYEMCSCGVVRCRCHGKMVPKAEWAEEMLCEITFFLSQLYEMDEDMNIKSTHNNATVDLIRHKLEVS